MTTDPKINIRMDLPSWNQIRRDLEKFYGIDVETTEIWESVEIQNEDGTWHRPADEFADEDETEEDW